MMRLFRIAAFGIVLLGVFGYFHATHAEGGCVQGGILRGAITLGREVRGFTTRSAGDVWTFSGHAGEAVRIDMTGVSGYDTYLEIFDQNCHSIGENDDGGGSLNARLETILPYDGTYSINARGYSGKLGGYTLTLVDEENVDQDGPIHGAADVGEIRCGQTVTNFTATAEGDQYTFTATAGEVIGISMTGANGYDTYLELYNPHRGQIGSDDDSGGSLNARLQATLPEAGTYYIIARGYSGRIGSYSLILRCGAEAGTVDRLPHNPYNMGVVTCGQTVNGATVNPAGDQYTFTATANQTVTITLNGRAGFDPYLELFGPDNIRVTYNDDGGGGRNARIVETLTIPGNYAIISRGYTGRVGAYSLTLQCSGMGVDVGTTINGAISLGELFCSQEESGRTTNASGNQYSFNGEAGQTVTLEMSGSTGFMPVLELYDESRTLIAEGESTASGSGVRIETRLPSTGGFLVIARGTDTATGTYTLEMTCGSGTTGTQTAQMACNGSSGRGYSMGLIGFGQSINSFTINQAGDSYLLNGSAGEQIVITMNGVSGYDTYLELYGPDCREIAHNDDGGGGLNARITATLPSSGTYTIIARGYGGRTGSYSLQVMHQSASTVTPRP